MNFYSIYKQIKERLGWGVPVFFYIGQYLVGKDNTSYRVPAIYVELPKQSSIDYYAKTVVMKDSIIKIHLITYAPFKNHENSTQDEAIAEHEDKLRAIDKLLNGCHAIENIDTKISEQFITDGGELMQFKGMYLVSVLSYKTELYSHHLKT